MRQRRWNGILTGMAAAAMFLALCPAVLEAAPVVSSQPHHADGSLANVPRVVYPGAASGKPAVTRTPAKTGNAPGKKAPTVLHKAPAPKPAPPSPAVRPAPAASKPAPAVSKPAPAAPNSAKPVSSAATSGPAPVKQAPAAAKPAVVTVNSAAPKPAVAAPSTVKAAPVTKTRAQLKAERKAEKERLKAQKKAAKAALKEGRRKNKAVVSSRKEPAKSVYTVGDSGWKVKVAQINLKKLGYAPGTPDGKFTSGLEKTLRQFQKDYRLRQSGKLDNETYQRLTWEAFAKEGNKKVKSGNILKTASRYQGVKYVFGGTTPKGFDCSGYVQYVFDKNGIKLTRLADTQVLEGVFVTMRQLKPGDLVFFTTYAPGASHVGIYAGGNKFWNATSSRGVRLCDLREDYWRSRYYGARRVLVTNGPQ